MYIWSVREEENVLKTRGRCQTRHGRISNSDHCWNRSGKQLVPLVVSISCVFFSDGDNVFSAH